MRRVLTLVLGMLIGQWLAFAATPSPATFHALGLAAWERTDYAEALRLWSHGAALQPDNALLQYRRATALARLGQPSAAADAYRLVVLLEPSANIARLAEQGLVSLNAAVAGVSDRETTVPVESSRGVWMLSVVLNGGFVARFILDTGSTFTIIAPSLAHALGLPAVATSARVELQTLAGQTVGAGGTLASIRVGEAELRDVAIVVHDPGSGVDGILGNSFLGHYRLTLDADRRLLHLRPTVRN